MGEPIYVSLEDLTIREEDEERVLVRQMGEDILNGTFREVVEKMMDTQPDPVYGEEYNLNQKKFAETLKAKYDNMINDSNSRIQFYTRDIEEKPIGPFSLEAKLGDYTNEVLFVRKNKHGDIYKSITIMAEMNGGGSYL